MELAFLHMMPVSSVPKVYVCVCKKVFMTRLRQCIGTRRFYNNLIEPTPAEKIAPVINR